MSNSLKLLTEWRPFEYSADMIKESREKNDGKIILKGVLQKSDTLNQNGRVYPRAILEREINLIMTVTANTTSTKEAKE